MDKQKLPFLSGVIAESMWRTLGWVLRKKKKRSNAVLHAAHLRLEEYVVEENESPGHDVRATHECGLAHPKH